MIGPCPHLFPHSGRARTVAYGSAQTDQQLPYPRYMYRFITKAVIHFEQLRTILYPKCLVVRAHCDASPSLDKSYYDCAGGRAPCCHMDERALPDVLLPCSYLTALGLDLLGNDDDEGADETIAALVAALPQLQALDLGECVEFATDTGLPACNMHACLVTASEQLLCHFICKHVGDINSHAMHLPSCRHRPAVQPQGTAAPELTHRSVKRRDHCSNCHDDRCHHTKYF